MITLDLVLAHYDESIPLKLHCDASFRGLSAVIFHVYSGARRRPINFASRSLSKLRKTTAT